MAALLVNIAFSHAGGHSVDALVNASSRVENITAPITSKATVATAAAGEIARIAPVGGDVYATAGAAPTAGVGDWLVRDGAVLLLVPALGDKIAVIDR